MSGIVSTLVNVMQIRNASPDDYPTIIAVVDDWWGGRRMASKLPHLFFEYFKQTSFVATDAGVIKGFVAGFRSQSSPEIAYIHFVGIDPESRGSGLGRLLYEHFFEQARLLGCTEIHCVTSPINTRSIAFHQAMGFEVMPGTAISNGIAFTPDFDGPDGDCVRFRYMLSRFSLSHGQ